ncbi:DUF2516 family protein [Cellulomonas sp. NPDC089187]|uniref:DUF2516 family protein n=1 Tax=Cellulomonas sp. NPDC089187 TaxID=3154970 RepID=UPI00343DF91F
MIFGSVQVALFGLFYLAIFALSLWALIDAARRPAGAFVAAGKRTKQLWLIVLGVATGVSFIALPPLGALRFLALLAAVAAAVYLVDVKPAVSGYSGGGRRGGSSRGGW